MKVLLTGVVMWFVWAMPAFAYVVVEPTFPEQYEPYVIESDFYTKTTYLSTLIDDPQLYQIEADVSDVLPLQLSQRATDKPEPMRLLIIEVLGDGNGVREVARQNVKPEAWQLHKDNALGVSLRRTPVLDIALTPGTYQIEVSTPDNNAVYALELGVDTVEAGYFTKLGAVRDIQSHFGYSFLRMLGSSLVYWPLFALLVLVALYKLYKLHVRI